MADKVLTLEVDGRAIDTVSDMEITTTGGKFTMWPPTRDQKAPERVARFNVSKMPPHEGIATLVDDNGWTVHELEILKLDTRIVPGEGAIITVSAKLT